MVKEQTSLEFEINKQMTLLQIDEYAQNVLGMVKMDDSNVTYLQNDNTESFEIAGNSQSVSGLAGYIKDKLKDYAQAIWSFIN
jgi:hypothetical protein